MDLHKFIGFSYRKYSAEAALGLFGRLGGLKSIIYNPQAIGKHARVLVSDQKNKRNQIKRTKAFKIDNRTNALASLRNLQNVAMSDGNVFNALLDAVEYATVGQITNALSEVWGKFRPSM